MHFFPYKFGPLGGSCVAHFSSTTVPAAVLYIATLCGCSYGAGGSEGHYSDSSDAIITNKDQVVGSGYQSKRKEPLIILVRASSYSRGGG